MASLAVLILALAAAAVLLYTALGALREVGSRYLEAVASYAAREEAAPIEAVGGLCRFHAEAVYYLVLNSSGAPVYEGPQPPPCPRAPGLYTYRAVGNDGTIWTARLYVGPLQGDVWTDVAQAEVDEQHSNFTLSLYARLVNPGPGYVPAPNLSAAISGCPRAAGPAMPAAPGGVIPPGGSLVVSLGTWTCAVDIGYILRGGPPSTVWATVRADYGGATLLNLTLPVARYQARRPQEASAPGSFERADGVCRVEVPGRPVRYMLINSTSWIPMAEGPTDGSVPCPPSPGDYVYRIATADGAIWAVPVSVASPAVALEAHPSLALVGPQGQVQADIYIDMFNYAHGHLPVDYVVELRAVDSSALSCSPSRLQGSSVVPPRSPLRAWAGSTSCVLSQGRGSAEALRLNAEVYIYYGNYIIEKYNYTIITMVYIDRI